MSIWNKDTVTLLIEEYRKHPNLYKVKSPNYKNRNLRKRSLDQILSTLQVVMPNVTLADIQSKILTLKQNAMKEFKKHSNSLKSGAGEEEIYMASLWYFDIISYIFDHNIPRAAVDSLQLSEEILIDEDLQETIEIRMDEAGNEEETPSTSSTFFSNEERSYSFASALSEAPKSKKKKDDDTFLNQVSKNLEILTSKLATPINKENEPLRTNDPFANYVAQKLKQITNQDVRDETEEKILNVLMEGIRKNKSLK